MGRGALPFSSPTQPTHHSREQDSHGQIMETHSISAGLDYPGVGPEHSHLKASGRAQYVAVTDKEALAAIQTLSRCEGIIPALEPAHAIAHVMKIAPTMAKTDVILLNMCGRGDKVRRGSMRKLGHAVIVIIPRFCGGQDMTTVAKALGFYAGEGSDAAPGPEGGASSSAPTAH